MSYLDMLNVLIHMNEIERRAAIAEHRRTVLSPGFVGFIQAQVEQGRAAVTPRGFLEQFLTNVGLNPVGQLMRARYAAVVAVWQSMQVVSQYVQAQSQAAGPRVGRAVGNGCGSVLFEAAASNWEENESDQNQAVLQDHIEYVRQQDEIVSEQIDYQRGLDDQQHYDHHVDYSPSYSVDAYTYESSDY